MSVNATELERLIVKVMADANDYHKGMDAVIHHADRVGKAATRMGTAMSLGVTLPLSLAGRSMVNAASDAEETQAKFETVFQNVSDKAANAAQVLDDSYGMSAQGAQKLLGDTGDMLTGFGFAEDAALDLSLEVQKLATDLASFQNLEGGASRASEALTKGLLGERDSMKALGIAILEEDVKKRVLENTNKGLTFATERQAKAYATLTLAQEQSKNAIGDYARTQDGYANQQRELKADLADLSVMFGKILLPQAQKSLALMRRGVKWVAELSEEKKKLAVRIAAVAAALGPLLLGFGAATTTAVKLTGVLRNVSTAFKVVSAASKAAWLSSLAPIAPLLVGIAAVTAAIAGITYLLVGPEGMATAWTTAKGFVLNFVDKALGFINNFSENMGILFNWIKANWQEVMASLPSFLVKALIAAAQNTVVGLRVLMRLWTAWQGFLVGMIGAAFDFLFSEKMIKAVTDGAVKVILMIDKMATSIMKVVVPLATAVTEVLSEIPNFLIQLMVSLASKIGPLVQQVLSGSIPNPAEILEELVVDALRVAGPKMAKAALKLKEAVAPVVEAAQEFGNTLAGDFEDGMQDLNFGKTAAGILKDEAKNFKSAGALFEDGFNIELPQFNFNRGDGVGEEIVEPLKDMETDAKKATEQVEMMNKEIDKARKPIKFNVEGIEAAERGSIAALTRINQQRALLAAGAFGGLQQRGAAALEPKANVAKDGKDERHQGKLEELLEKIAINTDNKTAITIEAANIA